MDTIGLIVMVVVLVLLVGGIIGYIKTQRELVNLDEKCKNALSQIEVQLNSRWDALMSLAKAATSYAQHEAETLAATIAARRGVEIHTAADVNEQQDAFSDALGESYVGGLVVESKNVITAKGPGLSSDFAFCIIEHLAGSDAADAVYDAAQY